MLTAIPDIPGLTPHPGPDIGEETDGPDHTDVDLIGVFVGIDYRAANGEVSSRRISIAGVTGTCIKAWCHEREARRTFRADRVISFFDLDGVVYTPAEFYACLGAGDPDMSAPYEWRSKAGNCLRRPWRREISVLAALSRSDGFMHPAEVEAIIQFVGTEAEFVGTPYTGADLDALAQTVRRLKIAEADAIEHLEVIARDRGRPYRRARLNRAITQVIDADGVVHPAEFDFAAMAREALDG